MCIAVFSSIGSCSSRHFILKVIAIVRAIVHKSMQSLVIAFHRHLRRCVPFADTMTHKYANFDIGAWFFCVFIFVCCCSRHSNRNKLSEDRDETVYIVHGMNTKRTQQNATHTNTHSSQAYIRINTRLHW